MVLDERTVTLVAQAEPQNMSDFVDSLSESPDDVAETVEQLTAEQELDAGQSSDAVDEQVAPDDTEQQEAELEVDGVEEGSDSSDPAPVAAANWDSPENPHFAAAQAFAQLQQLAAQQQEEQAQQSLRARHKEDLAKLADVDEDDIDSLTDHLIEEISQTSVRPYAERVGVLEHGLMAVIAALEDEGPDVVARVKERAAEKRGYAQSAAELEAATKLERQIKSKADADMKRVLNENKNLKAQLAAKVITESGANRTETVAVGANESVPQTWDELFGDRY